MTKKQKTRRMSLDKSSTITFYGGKKPSEEDNAKALALFTELYFGKKQTK